MCKLITGLVVLLIALAVLPALSYLSRPKVMIAKILEEAR